MRRVRLEPIGEVAVLQTGRRLLDALLAKNVGVLMSCGGRGICSTCHVHVCAGMEQLSPISPRERRTLSLVANATPESRLACQALVFGDGIEVCIPEGMYIESANDLISLLGTRARQNILHPITGEILIPVGKLITRTLLEQSRGVDEDVRRMREQFTDSTVDNDRHVSLSFSASGVGIKSKLSNTTQVTWKTTVEWRVSESNDSGSRVSESGSHHGEAAGDDVRLYAEGKGYKEDYGAERDLSAGTRVVGVAPVAPYAVPAGAGIGYGPGEVNPGRGVAGERDVEVSPGSQIGKYLILECIGRGGSGIVYRGLHTTLKSAIAIKFLNPNTNDERARERLAREARLLAQLSHPNIVRVLDYEDHPVRPFVVMEYIEGLSAAELIKQCGRLEWRRAVKVALDAAYGLQAALRYNIIHRDVKPGNILVARDGVAKLVDLGLAVTVRYDASSKTLAMADNEARIEGTIGYIAPETLSHGLSDHRSDIYSLGGTLFHLVAGRLPFEGRSAAEVMMKHVRCPVPVLHEIVPDCPPTLSMVIQRMMAKSPDERYHDYGNVIQALAALTNVNQSVNR